nr:MAG TPA: hypothetical protein [Caudoviricetes sp.]
MAKSDKTVLVSDENHVILDKWYYEELINTAARVDVLITLIGRDKFISITNLLTILDTPKGNSLLREMDLKLSEEKGDAEECEMW